MAKTKIVTLRLPKEVLGNFIVDEVTPKKRGNNKKPTIEVSTPVKTENRRGIPRSNQKLSSTKGDASPATESPEPENTPITIAPASSNAKSNLSTNPVITSATPVTTSTAAATSNSTTTTSSDTSKKLDKSGTQSRRWTKKPLVIQNFTGYTINFKSWTGDRKINEAEPQKQEEGDADNENGEVNEPTSIRINMKLNNKNLDLVNDLDQSSAPSPFADDISSIVSTPDISRVSTPVPE